MLEIKIFQIIMYIFLSIAGVVFGVLFFITAGYGRYNNTKWGPQMDNRFGWILMESVSPIAFFIFFFIGNKTDSCVAIVFLIIWEVHYIQRAFIYPLLIRGDKTIPISIVIFGFTFNLINSYLQGRYLFTISKTYKVSWFFTSRFIAGLIIFLSGYVINLHSDYILRNLRKDGDTSYYIPQDGMFRYVSCPNYLGEIMEWVGWAILTWSFVGLIFALWTMANLIPRAVSHHKWYKKKFENYPKQRRAIFPFILIIY